MHLFSGCNIEGAIFMRDYVERRRARAFASAARGQSALIARAAADPAREEAAVMAWIEEVSDTGGWTTDGLTRGLANVPAGRLVEHDAAMDELDGAIDQAVRDRGPI